MNAKLKTLGISKDIPINVLLSERFNPYAYSCTNDEIQIIQALRDVVTEYLSPKKLKTISKSSDAAAQLSHLRALDHEEVWVIFMNSSNHVLACEQISKGGLESCLIDCKSILKQALCLNARSLILAHNHPSGNPIPSESDIKQTKKLKSSCKTLEIEFTDHLIISRSKYYSFCDELERNFKNKL